MRSLFAILLALSAPCSIFGQNYVISTFAGEFVGFSGDNGPAIAAGLDGASDAAIDSAGNVYIADSENNRVRQVSRGVITTVAGNGMAGFSGDNGLATSAALSVIGVAVDPSGNLYIIGGNRIRKVSNGMITTVAGNGTEGFSGDNGPAISSQLSDPNKAAVDSAGNLYIADFGNHRIRKVSNGIITTVAGNGTTGYGGDNGLAINAELAGPEGIAVDSEGNIYVSDLMNASVRKISNGVITTVAGSGAQVGPLVDGPATGVPLPSPIGVAVDSAGNLYITGASYNTVRKVSNGLMTTIAGMRVPGSEGDGGPATSAGLDYPFGIAVDSAGAIYIADSGNSRIRILNPSGDSFISSVTNGASNLPGSITPGEIVVLSGIGIGPVQLSQASVGRTAVTIVSWQALRSILTECAHQ
jgi:sugar lactone lactonase YvrE